MHRSIDALMETVCREEIEFIRREDCKTMIGSEQYYSRYLMSKAQVDVEVHTQNWGRVPGMLFKITGTNAAIQTIKKQISYFRRRGYFLENIQRGGFLLSHVWTEGAPLLILEGSDKHVDRSRVFFEDYTGPRHPAHDNTGLYNVRLSEVTSASLPFEAMGCEYDEFRSHFHGVFKRIMDLSTYNVNCNGPLLFEVKFGAHYMVNVPRELIESSDGVSTRQIKDEVATARLTGRVTNSLMWLEEISRMCAQSLKKGVRRAMSGLESAFLPRIDPTISSTVLLQMLRNRGFKELGFEEGYFLTCQGNQGMQVAKYDVNGRLIKVFYPPLKWMVSDVCRQSMGKRPAAVDIRFELISQRHHSANKEARELKSALSLHNGRMGVSSHLMHKTEELRYMLESQS